MAEGRGRHPIRPGVREKFLAAVAAGMSQLAAAKELGYTPGAFYHLALRDPGFREELEEAKRASVPSLEAILERRADGWVEHTYDKNGEVIRSQERWNPAPVFALLNHRDPGGGWRDNTGRIEITGAGGGPVQVVQKGVTLHAVTEVLRAAGALPDAGVGAGAARPALPAAGEVLAESVSEDD